MTRPPEQPEWNPNVGKPTIWEFIERFRKPFDIERDYWSQIIERLCDWFRLHGTIILHQAEEPHA